MSRSNLQETAGAESLVAEVLDEFRERLKRGESPEVEEYAARFPQVSALLRDVLATFLLLERSLPPEGLPCSPGETVGSTQPLGDFRILRLVGRGGMGIVYEAEQLSLGRRVALKVLPFAATMDARHLQRFHNEARAAASLHHPHIVPVYGVGCERAVHFYAMQFIDGRSLAQILHELRTAQEKPGPEKSDAGGPSRATPLPAALRTKPEGLSGEKSIKTQAYFRRVAQLGIQVAEALEHAHSQGIVHRDIKPGNLLVDNQGQVWVTDFGLAQMQAGGSLTMSGDVIGTLRYMSPEQALAKHGLVDHHTDIYSLGATLYELLTLEPAVDGRDRQEIFHQIALEEALPPRKLNPAIPVDLETILMKALAKEPGQRYATAQALADDLRRWCEDRPIIARRPLLVNRMARWCRRHRILIAAATSLLVLGVVMLAGGTVLIWQEKKQTEAEKDRAVQAEGKAVQERDRALIAEQNAQQERDRALIAERKAEAGRVLANEVNQFFFEELLAPNSPYSFWFQPQGAHFPNSATDAYRDIRLRTMVDNAAGQVPGRFPGRPLAEAFVRRTIGLTYAYLGDNALGKTHLDFAYKIFGRELGEDHPDTLRTRVGLARVTQSETGVQKMEPVWLQLLEGFRRTLGEDHPDTLQAKFDLANCLVSSGQLVRPPAESGTVVSQNCLASSGQLDRAMALLTETLAGRRRQLGEDHPKTLETQTRLARLFEAKGEPFKAEALFLKTLEAQRKKRGKDHPETLATQYDLAGFYRGQGQNYRAEQLWVQTLEQSRKFGEYHWFPNVTRGCLMYCYQGQKKYPEMAALLLEIFKIRPKLAWLMPLGGLRGEEHWALRNALNELLNYYHKEGQSEKCEALLRAAFETEKDMPQALLDYANVKDPGRWQPVPVEIFRVAAKIKPDFPEAQFQLAAALEGEGKRAEATQAFRTGLKYQPGNAPAHNYLGVLLREQGKSAEALEKFRLAVKHQPDYPEARGNLGLCLARQGKAEEAIQEFRLATKDQPRLREAFVTPKNLPQALVEYGKSLRGIPPRRGEAFEAFRLAVNYQPGNAEAFNALGDALSDQGKWAEAMEQWRLAVKYQPGHARAHCSLGFALSKQGKPAEAIEEFRLAIKYQPDFAPAHFFLGNDLSNQGKWAEAIEEWRLAVKYEPDNAEFHNHIAWSLVTVADSRWHRPAEAVLLAQRAVKLAPHIGGIWNTLGVALYRHRDFQKAIEALSRSVELQKGNEPLDFLFLAMAHQQLKNTALARQWYDRAVPRASDKILRFGVEAEKVLGLEGNFFSPRAGPSQGSLARHSPPLPWLGYTVRQQPARSAAEIGPYTNIVVDHGWPNYGDELIRAARKAGLKVVLVFFGMWEKALFQEKGLTMAEKNRDVVTAVCWSDPYECYFTAQDVVQFGNFLKGRLPGVQFWVLEFNTRGQIFPSAVDVLLLDLMNYLTHEAEPPGIDDQISSFKEYAGGRPVLIYWSSFANQPPGLVPRVVPGALAALAGKAQKAGLAGLIFDNYGSVTGYEASESNPLNVNALVGLHTRPELIKEIQGIARDLGIKKARPSP